jgi:hypothetical protein
MKTPSVIGLVAASVLITIVIQESRIKSLRAELKAEKESVVVKAVGASSGESAKAPEESTRPLRTRSKRPEPGPVAGATEEFASGEDSIAKTARKMWDNPAGRSMMNQGVKMAVGMFYQDFIDGLDLSREEADYFKTLLGREMSDQQELGMKMLGATDEERNALTDEIGKRSKDAEEEIKKFLNSDEDFKKYTDYKNRLPERQQLDAIRATMSGKGVPLDAETETRLVDAMYRARTESKAPDFSGPGAMDELAKGNIVETFEKSWASQQETLNAEAGKILSGPQLAAFQEYQKQAKEMQMMGLKMAEKMMPGKIDESE